MDIQELYLKQMMQAIEVKEKLKDPRLGKSDIEQDINRLIENYVENIHEIKLVTKVSDRLQKKLNKTNEALDQKNKALQETLDKLTKANAGKKATTIVFILGIVLFVFEEFLIEAVVKHHFGHENIWIGVSAKIFIALGLKPLEMYLEHKFIEHAMEENKRKKMQKQNIDTIDELS
jgi:malate synthase